jgi:hypothetical protein
VALKTPARVGGNATVSRPCGESGRHVGVVFVHGIGSQPKGQTLREWGSHLVDLIADLRESAGMPRDPVILIVNDADDDLALVELELPQNSNGHGHDHWVLTEASWASAVASPSFGTMAEWLGPRGALRQVVTRLGPELGRQAARVEDKALAQDTASNEDTPVTAGTKRAIDASRTGERAFRFGVTKWAFVALGSVAQAWSSLLLVLYGFLRTIERILPIGPLKDKALTRPIDSLMLDWFGDVYVLLMDPVQQARVRDRLMHRIQELRTLFAPDDLAVVAHSGGALVSYMTLSRPITKGQNVTRLITLGEGINLAIDLAAADLGRREARKRYGLNASLMENHPNLVWSDFFATHDPAPSGRLDMKDDVAKELDSRRIVNRLSIASDHGTYWDNDAEFTVPLMQLLNTPTVPDPATPARSLFPGFRSDDDGAASRERRVALLAVWQRLCAIAGVFAIIGTFALGSRLVPDIGTIVASGITYLPGSDQRGDFIQFLREFALLPDANRLVGVADAIGEVALAITLGLVGLALLVPRWRISELLPPPGADRPPRRWPNLLFGFVIWYAGYVLVFIAFVNFLDQSAGGLIDRVLAAAGLGLVLGFIALVAFGRGAWLTRVVPRNVLVGFAAFVTMIAGVGLVFAVAVAISVNEETGTAALGCVAILLAAWIVRAIGVWRWNAWDRYARAAWTVGITLPPGLTSPSKIRFVRAAHLLLAGYLAVMLAFLFLVAIVDVGSGTLGLALSLAVIAIPFGVAIDILTRTPAVTESPESAETPNAVVAPQESAAGLDAATDDRLFIESLASHSDPVAQELVRRRAIPPMPAPHAAAPQAPATQAPAVPERAMPTGSPIPEPKQRTTMKARLSSLLGRGRSDSPEE